MSERYPTHSNLKIPIASTSDHFVASAAQKINVESASFYEPIGYEGKFLSISAIDSDLFLEELANTGISHFEWQRIKQKLLKAIQRLRPIDDRHRRSLTDSLDSCKKLKFPSVHNSQAPI